MIGVCELLKDVYSIALKYSWVHTEYFTIYKTFEIILQSIVHEDNIACLKFITVPNIYSQTTHIAIPYHFFKTNIEQLKIKFVSVSTDNQLVNQLNKGITEKKFLHDHFVLMGWYRIQHIGRRVARFKISN